jgi:peptidoglycan hydrolase-like protein with peptidoglycan-binding domain
LTAQQQTTLQQSVLQASNAPRVNANSINFQVHAGVALPSSISVVSVSTYPALIDVFPAYRDYSFFIVEDEVVFVDRDRRIVDVVPAGPRTRFSGGRGGQGSSASVAVVDLPPDDIRVVQRVLIERGLLRGEADGILGTQTREAISVFQRQQGIQVTGSIDAGTVSSLGVSARLSQQANQSIGQSQSSTTGAQTSTGGQGQAGTGQTQTGQTQTGQPQPAQQNATGQAPSQNPGQAATSPAQQNQPSTTTGQSAAPNQPSTTGQAAPQTQSGNQPTVNPNPPTGQMQGTGSSTGQPAQSSTPSR